MLVNWVGKKAIHMAKKYMNMKRKKLKTDDEFTRIGCSWYPNIFLVWIWCFLSFMLKVMCTPLQRGNRTQKKWNQFILNIEYWILRLHPVSILNYLKKNCIFYCSDGQQTGVVNKGVGLCNEAVPVQVRQKGGWESKDSSLFVQLPMKVCT